MVTCYPSVIRINGIQDIRPWSGLTRRVTIYHKGKESNFIILNQGRRRIIDEAVSSETAEARAYLMETKRHCRAPIRPMAAWGGCNLVQLLPTGHLNVVAQSPHV